MLLLYINLFQMLKPPFYRPPFLPPPGSPPPSNENTLDVSAISPTTWIRHIPPAAVRHGNTFARTKDDPDAYYMMEVRTERTQLESGL